jgi:hypothetical protein
MLVDITYKGSDPVGALVADMGGRDGFQPAQLCKGVWQWGNFNPEYEVHESLKVFPELGPQAPPNESTGDRFRRMIAAPTSYGVCDCYSQVTDNAEYSAVLCDPDRRFTIFVVELLRKNEVPGGWRWHKWGPYIGVHEPQCEYLNDEPDIERVFTFSIKEHV